MHVKCTVTDVLFQPARFADGTIEADTAGATWSMLMPETAAERELSAASTAVPDTDCAAPSTDTVVLAGHDTTPDNASLHTNDTGTGELNQPFTFATGTTPEINGAVLSKFTVVEADDELPATSEADPDTNCPAPSDDTTCGDEHDATPEPVSPHVNETVTSPLFQPAPFATGDCDTTIEGASRSIFTVTTCDGSTLPAKSTLQNSTECTPSSANNTDEPDCTPPPSTTNLVTSTPDKPSDAARITVTVALFHSGSVDAEVVGA